MPSNDRRGSHARWQAISIAQLTYAINLILGLSVATLGFQTGLLLGDKFVPTSWQKCAFALSLLLLLVSVGLGIWCVINRLLDFRATTRAARLRETGAQDAEIQPHRAKYEKLGDRTWLLFCAQLGTFGVGLLFTLLSVWASIGDKLL